VGAITFPRRASRRLSLRGVLGLVALATALACAAPAAPPPAASKAGAPAPGAPAAPAPASAATAAPAGAPTAPPQPLAKVRSAVLTSSAQDGPVYIADERGYFREQGLEVEIIKFATATEIIPALAQGHLDVGAGGTGAALFNGLATGLDIRIVADKGYAGPDSSPGWLVRTDLADQIRTPADVRGRAFGMGNQGSSPWVELEVMLRQGGLTLDDIEIKNVGYTDQIVAFANRSIDITYSFEPNITNLVRNGVAVWWKASHEFVPNHEGSVVIYGANFVKQPDLGRRYMVAWLKGVRDYNRLLREQRDDGIIAIMIANTDIKDPAAWKEMRLPVINPDGYVFPESMNLGQEYYLRAGQQQRRADIAQAIDHSYVDYALGVLGRQ
jgi:NitT/TauT family transport system substrate-binding protein